MDEYEEYARMLDRAQPWQTVQPRAVRYDSPEYAQQVREVEPQRQQHDRTRKPGRTYTVKPDGSIEFD